MTKGTSELLEKVRKLPAAERQELCEAIIREGLAARRPAGPPKKRIADIAGKYSPELFEDAADHDRGFVEAIIASKGRSRAA
jgi:hypothetical protein